MILIWALIGTVFLVLLIVSLGLKRHGEHPIAQPNWQSTDERFRDPSTGRVMRVWIDPGTGSRHYVPEP